MVMKFPWYCWCVLMWWMRIEVSPKYHCKRPTPQQSHKIERYHLVTVSNGIEPIANRLGRKMQPLQNRWIFFCVNNNFSWHLRNAGCNSYPDIPFIMCVKGCFATIFLSIQWMACFNLPKTAERFTCRSNMLSVQETMHCIKAIPTKAPATICAPSVHDTNACQWIKNWEENYASMRKQNGSYFLLFETFGYLWSALSLFIGCHRVTIIIMIISFFPFLQYEFGVPISCNGRGARAQIISLIFR